jgi:hypothetical protein
VFEKIEGKGEREADEKIGSEDLPPATDLAGVGFAAGPGEEYRGGENEVSREEG